MNRPLHPLALLGLLAAAVAGPALADPNSVREVRVAVIDPRTNRELTTLAPGDTLQLPRDEERVLRLFEPSRADRMDRGGDRGRDRNERRYLPVKSFGFGPEQTEIELSRESKPRGEVTVRLRPGTRLGGDHRLHIGWRLADDLQLASEDLRLGRLLVDVVGPSQDDLADRLVAALYRGILLRDPDAGAAGLRNDVARNGWPAVLRQARAIAESRESEIDIYARGACNQQRLLAMYQHLLGRDSASIDQRLWRDQLQHLGRGDIARVVSDLVDSREFQDRFRFWNQRRR